MERLEQALIEAKEANAAKTEFLSRMSHDMRTPMNAILGLTALTLDEVDKPEVVTENLEKINSASQFLLGLINDILDMAKIEDGAVELKREAYSYTEFIESLRTMFETSCREKGICLKIGQLKNDYVFMTDRVRLNQIFFNLLSNAVKFTPEGGTVVFQTENLQIQDNIVSCDFIVADTGIGISEKFQKKMFQPFAREDNAVSSQVQGTGLGLSITKSLVDLMGGSMQVESTPGKGSRFIVSLCFEIARDKYERSSQVLNTDFDDQILADKRVLLVDDHPLNVEIAKKLLIKKKVSVYCAENGKVAVDKFSSSSVGFFDAILMDIRMPVMDGMQAARQIRSMERADAEKIPIIAMTANAYDEDVKMSREAGMNVHLAKPIEPKKLYHILAEMLRKGGNAC